MNNFCPKCHAPLQENAKFCPHCMTQFDKKVEIAPPKKKNKPLKIVLFTVVPIILVIAIVLTCVVVKKHQPICTYENFCKATPMVSQKMGIDSLWDSDGFIDTHIFEDEDIIQYSTKTYLGGPTLSVFFYNEGEEIYAYISDVNSSVKDDAESILKCVTQSACNYYFTDIDDVFDNEELYPKSTLNENYISDFTDLLKKTDTYEEEIASGTQMSTRYISMTNSGIIIAYFETEKVNPNGITKYDLALEIMRK